MHYSSKIVGLRSGACNSLSSPLGSHNVTYHRRSCFPYTFHDSFVLSRTSPVCAKLLASLRHPPNGVSSMASSKWKPAETEHKKRHTESGEPPGIPTNAPSPEAEPKLPSETKALLAKFGQRINISGILSTFRVILKDQRLILPHLSVPDISWIEWSVLRQRGFKGVIFDKDNTLTAPYQSTIWPPLAESLQNCLKVFEGNVALLSNSAGLQQFDPYGLHARALETSLGISVIRHRTKKPAGTVQDLVKHFGCDPSLLVMVGDRYLTDIVYGNRLGLCTIHTAALSEIGEPLTIGLVLC